MQDPGIKPTQNVQHVIRIPVLFQIKIHFLLHWSVQSTDIINSKKKVYQSTQKTPPYLFELAYPSRVHTHSLHHVRSWALDNHIHNGPYNIQVRLTANSKQVQGKEHKLPDARVSKAADMSTVDCTGRWVWLRKCSPPDSDAILDNDLPDSPPPSANVV